jgi:hypothetical protein
VYLEARVLTHSLCTHTHTHTHTHFVCASHALVAAARGVGAWSAACASRRRQSCPAGGLESVTVALSSFTEASAHAGISVTYPNQKQQRKTSVLNRSLSEDDSEEGEPALQIDEATPAEEHAQG